MLLQIAAGPDAIHNGKQGVVDQRCEHSVPGAAVVVYALSGVGQEGEGRAGYAVLVRGDDDHERIGGHGDEGLRAERMEFYQVNEFVAHGGRVVALCECSWTNKRTGKLITLPKVDVWYLENGKVTEFMEYFDTHAAVEAAAD